MDNTDISELNDKVLQLSLDISSKTQELDILQRHYSKKLTVLNDYIRQLHKALNFDTSNGHITDEELISKLQGQVIDEEEFIVLPKKLIRSSMPRLKINKVLASETQTVTPLQGTSTIYNTETKNFRKSKSKMNCSACHEVGHKRSQCPQILYKNI